MATIAIQYTYLSSPMSVVIDPENGIDESRALFDLVYGHWTLLPPTERPRLYLHGLSLGAFLSQETVPILNVFGELRRMLHAHLRINPKTVRVRLAGFGAGVLKFDIRFYVITQEWNGFFAFREDVHFRMMEIVEAAGTGFAVPSQTLYLGQDAGLDPAKAAAAKEAVSAWRKAGQLPFPRLVPEEIERLKGTLAYPAQGIPEAGADASARTITEEARPLSSPAPDTPRQAL